MLLSAIMRVLNEEDEIRGCLRAFSEFCDEIVIVDGGSTDRTKEFALAFPKVVWLDYKGPVVSSGGGVWTPEGPQRNQALEVARGQWIFIVDADERPCLRMRTYLRALLGNIPRGRVALWGVHLLSPDYYARAWVSYTPGRLARVGRDYRFPEDRDRYVIFSNAWGDDVIKSDMALFHRYWIRRQGKKQLLHTVFAEAIKEDRPEDTQPTPWPLDVCSRSCSRCYLESVCPEKREGR